MRQNKRLLLGFGWALLLNLVLAGFASAASSFSNTLTGFTGDSTQSATQAALSTAGFNVFSTDGLNDDFTADPTAAFDANGVSFGALFAGDGGRNYLRTVESDYATASFVAEITVERTSNNQQAFIGMGAGDTALFGVPDWSTLFSSTFTAPEDGSLTTWRSSNDANIWSGDDPPSNLIAAGTHRVRLTFDATARTMTYAIDVDYAGGDFTADFSAPPTDLNHIDCPTGCGDPEMPISADFFGADGWPNEPSRLFFGGDDGAIFRDFTVTVSAAPELLGDYNGDNTINAADYTVWRNLLGTAGPLPHDPTPESIDSTDYDYWKAHFGQSLGSGGLAGAKLVPEPATLISLAWLAVGLTAARRRRNYSWMCCKQTCV